MQAKGWFKIPGVQDGDRTLTEQMKGLDRALVAARDRVVLDLGCAEGLIAQEFLKAGAAYVTAIEAQPDIHAQACRVLKDRPARVLHHDLNEPFVERLAFSHHHVVLLLAILHKLHRPEDLLNEVARTGPELIVVRLPIGSTGVFTDPRSHSRPINVPALMESHDFKLDETVKGPRKELVQYYTRT